MRVQRISAKWKYVVPRQGATFFVDNFAIPAGAPHKEIAMDFVNFMLDPKNIAKSTEFTRYANCVPSSKRYVQRGIGNDPYIYPNKILLSKLEMIQPVSGGVYEKAWEEVKAAFVQTRGK